MTALPASTDFTGASVTEAQFKTAITSLRDYLSGQFGTAGTVATALATLGALGGQWADKTTAYTVIASDRGKLVGCSGTFTLTLTAAATLGSGFSFAVLNYGSGTVTIDPDGTELVDGASTIALAAGESCVLMCTGSAWRAIGRATSNGEFRSVQKFTGSGTWTKPSGLKRVKVTVVGGGGGGANDPGSANKWNAGGGGGGASVKWIEAGSLGSTESVTVGGGGAGGTGSSYAAGAAGGSSAFGAHCSATGGAGGTACAATPVARPAGGAGSGGDLNISGQAGGSRYSVSDSTTTYLYAAGDGGASHLGTGGTGPYNVGHGAAGTGYGGGGAAGISNTTADYNGGNGAAGIVIVEEFF